MQLFLPLFFTFFYCLSFLFSEEVFQNLPQEEVVDFLFEKKCECGIKNHPEKGDFEVNLLDLSLSAECEPLTTIEGCVNVCSGRFFQIDEDLSSQAIEPLSLVRTYDSANRSESFLGYGFGSQFPLLASYTQKGSRHIYIMISEREGFLLPYRTKEARPSNLFWIDPRILEKGYTNLSKEAVSGHSNFVNWKAVYQKSRASPHGKLVVELGNGSRRIYSKCINLEKEPQSRLDFPTSKGYLLEEEIKPNGNRIAFSYKIIHGMPCLVKVQAFNRAKNVILDELNIDYSSKGCKVSSLYGETAEYSFEKKPCLSHVFGEKYGERKVLQAVNSSQKGQIIYQTEKEKSYRKIKKVEKPGHSFLLVKYEESLDGDKVSSLFEPCGKEDKTVETYRFHYHKDYTDVLDAHKRLTRYYFDRSQRLSHIDYLDEDQKPIRQEAFLWSKKEGEEGWLKAKGVQLREKIFYLKTYRYDQRGNIIRQTLYGNLTGQKKGGILFL